MMYAKDCLQESLAYSNTSINQAVFSPSALGLMYPADEIPITTGEECLDRLKAEAARNIQLDRIGTTDVCRLSPLGDNFSTIVAAAIKKASVQGVILHARILGVEGSL